MANRTVKDAKFIKGTNPQYLIEKIIRCRIYDCRYWKEECFALTAELLVDKAMELRYLGGVYGGNIKPSPFLCLVLKMLQIQPEKDIVVEFIKQDDFKYVRALGAFYMRLTGTSLDCYKYLEPLLNDFRKLRVQDRNGDFCLTHMDEYIDGLLREERVYDVIMPRIQKRWVHEGNNELDPRVSALEDDVEDMDESGEEDDIAMPAPEASRHQEPRRSEKVHRSHRNEKVRERDRDVDKRRDRDRYRERDRDREKYRGNERDKDYERRRLREGGDRERERYEREKERERGREKRHRSRSPDPGRHRRKEEKRREREWEHDRGKGSHSHKSRNAKGENDEIAEANALRAKLGLKPLR
ncbi:unnamed protein product [Darwinula stevensoni]|uniref:Pre-mRNA-splicing factor 38 n=1 Tax=Darwinula stevensoni TaxID=69355 RepID=A0A7R8X4A9_9CRUS|nr:unnamed protein product [Darwinula stevensoni]CAG0878859.1 unnamed protein product [Darwinula stevensoni]